MDGIIKPFAEKTELWVKKKKSMPREVFPVQLHEDEIISEEGRAE